MAKGLYQVKEGDRLRDTETNEEYVVSDVTTVEESNTGSVAARRVDIDPTDGSPGTSFNETWDAPKIGHPDEKPRYEFVETEEPYGTAEEL